MALSLLCSNSRYKFVAYPCSIKLLLLWAIVINAYYCFCLHSVRLHYDLNSRILCSSLGQDM